MVQAAQDDAGEVDGLCEIAHQGALESNHIPPEVGKKQIVLLIKTTVKFPCKWSRAKRNNKAKAWEDVKLGDKRGNSTLLTTQIFTILILPQQTPQSPPGDSSRSLIKVALTDCGVGVIAA